MGGRSTSSVAGRWFWGSAAAAIALHAWLLFGGSVFGASELSGGDLRGGADLLPHLRLIQQMGESPEIRSVYPPAYHALGALVTPWLGLAAFPKFVGLLGAIALIAGFRAFQRAAALPDAASALFAWAPYTFALSWCLPKIEAVGYGLALMALAAQTRHRYAVLALLLAATFWVHTAAALLLGLCGGVLALANRDRRALTALAVGALGALPLIAAHWTDGCTLAQALLFSPGDYLRANLARGHDWISLIALVGPIGLGLAWVGAPALWRDHRPLAWMCVVIVVLYLNELWLAPFSARTTLDLLRGLTILAIPVAIAGGRAVSERPRAQAAAIAACAAWAIGVSAFVVPGSCHTRPIELAAIENLRVDRCTFRWRLQRHAPGRPAAATSLLPTDRP